MTPSSPPLPPNEITARLRVHFGTPETQLAVHSIRREHAHERQELREVTRELRTWRRGVRK